VAAGDSAEYNPPLLIGCQEEEPMDTGEVVWLVIGFTAQTLFFSRFLVQWIVSERQKKSVIPTAFWYLSLGGGALLLCYAIYRKDPVFIVGQLTGVFVYSRNLWFIHRRPAEG
jgi:lipid-A-disaccharide synthase-like uncharacterized protein